MEEEIRAIYLGQGPFAYPKSQQRKTHMKKCFRKLITLD